MPTKTNQDFWRPPLWKWAIFVALVAVLAFVILHKPAPNPVKVELLPFPDSPPTWDGSYPYLVISPIGVESGHLQFKSAIKLIKPSLQQDSPVNEFSVDLHSGRFVLRQTDLFVPDVMPLTLTRTYVIWNPYSRAFGTGANHPYDICPTGTRFPYTYQNLNLEDGFEVYMPRISKGTGYADAVFRHAQTGSEFYGAQDAWNGNGWTLTLRDGRKIIFPEAYFAKNFAQGAPIEMHDTDGHRIQLKRDKVRNLEELLSPGGHTITFKYDSADRIIEADDDAGHVRNYSYDSSGHLEIVTTVLASFTASNISAFLKNLGLTLGS
jgi:YD repeat-containing protein